MLLKVNCRECHNDISFKLAILTRPDFISKRGEYFEQVCPTCDTKITYHANDVIAYHSNKYQRIVTAIGVAVIVLTTVMFLFVGFIATIGAVIGGIIIAAANGSSSTSDIRIFNAYKISASRQDRSEL